MPTVMLRKILLVVAALACACSDGGSSSSEPPPPPLGEPIEAPANQWTWIGFADSSCDEGTPTGIAVNRGTSGALLVFFNGGGACWDYVTCVQLSTSAHGPFGATQFSSIVSALGGTVLDRSDPSNPFRDDSFVFVPYCTGDVHAGSVDQTYTSGQASAIVHHAGHSNVRAYLKRLGATFPSATRVVVAGSSAGGYGATVNYPLFRWYWPRAEMALVDDSGPALVGSAVPYLGAWYASWRLGDVLDARCPGCRTDLSAIYPALAGAYPSDRMSLLSSDQDSVIRAYMSLDAAGFQTALAGLTAGVLDPLPQWRYFVVTGQTHTMLGTPGLFSQGGVGLWDFLGQQVSGDPGWSSVAP